MPSPLISIVIPAYNVEKYIEECLNSILNQTFQDWECIIVNDGSTDNTLGIIENFAAKDRRFSYYTIPNSGSAKISRDKAISYARADWIIPVDADDFIDSDVLEKLYARAICAKADIVYPRMKFFGDGSHRNVKFLPEKAFDMQKVLTGHEAVMLTIPKWLIGTNGEFIRKELWNARSTLNAAMKLMNMDEYDTREMLINAHIVAFEDVVYNYRQYPASIAKNASIKLFDTVFTDKMLEELFSRHFGECSRQKRLVSKYRIRELFAKRTILFRIGSKLPAEERKKARQIIKEHYPGNYALLEILSFFRCYFAIFAKCLLRPMSRK